MQGLRTWKALSELFPGQSESALVSPRLKCWFPPVDVAMCLSNEIDVVSVQDRIKLVCSVPHASAWVKTWSSSFSGSGRHLWMRGRMKFWHPLAKGAFKVTLPTSPNQART